MYVSKRNLQTSYCGVGGESSWGCTSILTLAASLPESASAQKCCGSIFMQRGCMFSGVILDGRTGAFQALHGYPFASQTRVITTAFIILWHMLPNSQTRISLFQSYPSIGHHTFLSGMSVLVLCMEPEVQICPQNSKCWWCALAVVFTVTCASIVQALGKAGKHLLYSRISSCFCLAHLYNFEVIHVAILVTSALEDGL